MHLRQFWHPNTRLLRSVLNPNTCASFGQFWFQILVFFGQFLLQIHTFFGQFWIQKPAHLGQFWHPNTHLLRSVLTPNTRLLRSVLAPNTHLLRSVLTSTYYSPLSVSSNIKSLKLHRLSLELFDLVFFAQPPKHNTTRTTALQSFSCSPRLSFRHSLAELVSKGCRVLAWQVLNRREGPAVIPRRTKSRSNSIELFGWQAASDGGGAAAASGNSRFFDGRPSVKVTGL